MAGLCEGGNEPSGSLKAICKQNQNVDNSTVAWFQISIIPPVANEKPTFVSPFPITHCESNMADYLYTVIRNVSKFPCFSRILLHYTRRGNACSCTDMELKFGATLDGTPAVCEIPSTDRRCRK
ncbi:hypothetical protein ANN_20582 [Periplaneta americana]|uniref:Uncharacterized protein n=1 Tax=Periplaneta americana TaxID=6978 RepID=A0ABQ8SDA4_PERAM|nr:hypothetical protein ANN_20582 [Periplaneta americana]